MTPGARLRALIAADRPAQAMAAHSPLSARLAEEAGFEAIWASGFELSAAFGLPDASFVSMTQHLDCTAAMAAVVQAPVVADLDTGFGNAVNLAYAVRRYEAAGAGAIVVEDKTFPKMTSLLADGRQELVRVEEFQGKIEAALSARTDPHLLVIARTEGLIADLGLAETLRRAHAYEEAGADLILVHSKRTTPDEILAFSRAWAGESVSSSCRRPIRLSTIECAKDLRNIALVIYGNHAIRAAAQAMRQTFEQIRQDGSSVRADTSIATVDEIFRLQRMDELKIQERRFLR